MRFLRGVLNGIDVIERDSSGLHRLQPVTLQLCYDKHIIYVIHVSKYTIYKRCMHCCRINSFKYIYTKKKLKQRDKNKKYQNMSADSKRTGNFLFWISQIIKMIFKKILCMIKPI